jgi:regulator of cell morphogenesis and NO signaling
MPRLTATLLLALALLVPSALAGDGDDRPWTPATPVGQVVARVPATARVFELVGIDYCCGGGRTLAEAAAAKGLDPDRLLAALLAVGPGPAGDPTARDWTRAPLAEVVAHIERTHHVFLRRELPRLTPIVSRVVEVHGKAHPELLRLKEIYDALVAALPAHLEAEEEIVFPGLQRLEEGRPPPDLQARLAGMRGDHDEVGASLHELRALTRGWTPPEGACRLYHEMLRGLAALEADLHAHVHLENNVLAPRAEARLAALAAPEGR